MAWLSFDCVLNAFDVLIRVDIDISSQRRKRTISEGIDTRKKDTLENIDLQLL